MKPPIPLSARPVGYLLTRAAEFRSMATTARTTTTAAALTRLAKQFENMTARRLNLPDTNGSG